MKIKAPDKAYIKAVGKLKGDKKERLLIGERLIEIQKTFT